MTKRELKVNLKSFIIWSSIIVFLLILVFLIYPSIKTNGSELDKLMELFPKEILEAFNMDIISISSVFGWLLSEGYLLICIIGACFASYLGSTILLKEENDKTINFLITKPISRKRIVLSRLVAGTVYLIIFNILIMITSIIGLGLSQEFEFGKWFAFSMGPLILHLFFFYFAVFISTFFRKTTKSLGVALGFTIGTYFLQVISKLSEKIDFIKYLSPYTYVDSRDIITSSSLPISYILVLMITMIVIIILTNYRYEKKEFF